MFKISPTSHILFIYIKFDKLCTGVCEIEEGEVQGQKLTTTSHTVGRLTFGKDPVTKKVGFLEIFSSCKEYHNAGDFLARLSTVFKSWPNISKTPEVPSFYVDMQEKF